MVDSVRPTPPPARPDAALHPLPTIGLTQRAYGEFKRILQAPQRPPHPTCPALSADGPAAPQEAQPRGPGLAPRADSDSLAPDPEAGGGSRPDPAEWLALINPPGGATELSAAPGEAGPTTPVSSGTNEVAELVERWVRRVALGGDTRRGVARLDIGSGRLAGAELLVTAEPGHVSVELSLPAGLEDAGLGERLRSRLARRGFESDVLVR